MPESTRRIGTPGAGGGPRRGAGGLRPPEPLGGSALGAPPPSLWPLVDACFGPSWSRALFERSVTQPEARLWVLATEAGQVVGFLLARRVLDGVELDLLGVESDRRREGIAGQLLGALIEAETSTGAREILLELRRSNSAAQGLYRRHGFVVVGERSRYYPDGEDALLWTRSLGSAASGGRD